MTEDGMVKDVSPEQPLNACPEITVVVFGIVIEVRPTHPWKAPEPIIVIELGMVISERLLQFRNVYFFISVMALDNVTLVNPLQLSKALCSISSTDSGMVMDFKLRQP